MRPSPALPFMTQCARPCRCSTTRTIVDQNGFEMPESTSKAIPLPKEGFLGVQALVDLGEERLRKLADAIAGEPLDLSFSSLCSRLAACIECDERLLQAVCFNALIPLNGLRRNLEMESTDFLNALVSTVSERAPDEWRESHWDDWQKVASALAPLLQPDNFFSQASKAFDLLSERPAILHNARILTELRPIFDEATTKTLAFLQTNTLVLNYWDGESTRSLHLTLDSSDLQKLQEELERAKEKIRISQEESAEQGKQFVVYGESLERS